jgi:Zn-dependent protease with chaperone function
MAEDASYFDGGSAKRRSVRLAFQTDGLSILDGSEQAAFWRYTDLRLAASAGRAMRLTAEGAPELARLEILDPALRQEIALRCPGLVARKEAGEAGAGRIVFWSLAAVVSLVLTAIYLVPLVADRLAPLIPLPLERRLGDAVDNQVRALFGEEACDAAAGSAALAKLSERLTGGAGLPMPAEIAVLPSEVPNAVALPGGYVHLFDGLLDRAEGPDEVAAVLAHELGHVAGRDGLRKLLQAGGTSFLLGLLFGDVTGGGAIVFAAQAMLDSRYSRGAEAAADAFAAELMLELGRSPKPLGAFLARLAGDEGDGLAFLSSHPVTGERVRALDAKDRAASGPPLLGEGEWRALKAICAK